MGEINIPDDEKAALRRIDVGELVTLVDRCMEEERIDALHALPLSDCGPYVSREFDAFERALSDHRESKGMQKRLGTWATADRRARSPRRSGTCRTTCVATRPTPSCSGSRI